MRNMKDSGIEWVGKIPEEWDVKANKYVMSKKKVLKPLYQGENILSLTMKGVMIRDLEAGGKMPSSFNGYQLLYPGNLLMCLFDYDVTPRCIGLIKNNGLTSPAYSQFEMKKGYSAEYYYYYYLMIDQTKALLHRAKNLRHSFTEEQLGAINVPVPTFDEQRKIALFLDSKCDEIEKLHMDIEKQIEILEEYKNAKIDEIFDFYFSNTEYRNIKLVRMSTLITKQTGFDYAETIKPALVDEPTRETIPFIQTKNFKNNYFSFDTDYYVPLKIAKRFPNIYLKRKCLLFSISGVSIGNVGIYPGGQDAFIGGAICKVDLLDEELCEYIKCFIMSSKAQNQLKLNIYATAQGNVTVQNIRDLKIPIFEKAVCLAIADKISIIISEVDNIIADLNCQLDILEEYRKTLIYEYVTGKKEVTIE